jgi:hypothetical protein
MEGEDGGGIAIELGIRGRGVLKDMRPLEGEGESPSLGCTFGPTLGVLKGDPMVLAGDMDGAEANDFRVGLSDPSDLLDNGAAACSRAFN